MAFPNISNEIWMNIFEEVVYDLSHEIRSTDHYIQFNEEFPHRLSEFRLVSRLFNDLIIPIRYRTILLADPWMQAPQSPLHEIIEDRITSYTQHVTFRGSRRDVLCRDVNLQVLLERCKRLQSIT